MATIVHSAFLSSPNMLISFTIKLICREGQTLLPRIQVVQSITQGEEMNLLDYCDSTFSQLKLKTHSELSAVLTPFKVALDSTYYTFI